MGPLVGGWGAFGSLSDAFGLPLALLCDRFSRPGVPVRYLWGTCGGPVGYLWGPFGHLGLPLAVF